MKKFIIIVLLITFISTFALPRKAMADGGAGAAIIGAAIGFVIAMVVLVIVQATDTPQKPERAELGMKMSGKSTVISDNLTINVPSDQGE